jgi:hypothetical protein
MLRGTPRKTRRTTRVDHTHTNANALRSSRSGVIYSRDLWTLCNPRCLLNARLDLPPCSERTDRHEQDQQKGHPDARGFGSRFGGRQCRKTDGHGLLRTRGDVISSHRIPQRHGFRREALPLANGPLEPESHHLTEHRVERLRHPVGEKRTIRLHELPPWFEKICHVERATRPCPRCRTNRMPSDRLEDLGPLFPLYFETQRGGGAVQHTERSLSISRERPECGFVSVAERVMPRPGIEPGGSFARLNMHSYAPTIEERHDAFDVRAPLLTHDRPRRQTAHR